MLASIQNAGFSSCDPVARLVIVHSQIGRSSNDFPISDSSSSVGYSAANASRISVNSGNLTNRSNGTATGMAADGSATIVLWFFDHAMRGQRTKEGGSGRRQCELDAGVAFDVDLDDAGIRVDSGPAKFAVARDRDAEAGQGPRLAVHARGDRGRSHAGHPHHKRGPSVC